MSAKFFSVAVLRRSWVFLVLGIVIAVLAVVRDVSTKGAIRRAKSSAIAASKQSAAEDYKPGSVMGVRRMEPVQVVRLTLYDVGIVPQQLYARAGLVTIAVEDLSGGTTGVIVERVDEGQPRMQAGQVRRQENKRHGREELRLKAGHYQLYMADRPENRAELIVEP